jgi:hypothetical protein
VLFEILDDRLQRREIRREDRRRHDLQVVQQDECLRRRHTVDPGESVDCLAQLRYVTVVHVIAAAYAVVTDSVVAILVVSVTSPTSLTLPSSLQVIAVCYSL